jgi:predicted transcriptional regulator
MLRQAIPESSTAFRLPRDMLATIDCLCEEMDLTRSQLLRRSITEYLKLNGHKRQSPFNCEQTDDQRQN